MLEIIRCVCGREPERNVTLRGYKHSLSCKCGGEQIEYLVRSDNEGFCVDNWHSLITGTPYKHCVQKIPHPDSDVVVVPAAGPSLLEADPERRYVIEHGGNVAGPWGGCC